ncbi:LysR substrate-binding domain-containing protein [Devosia salina]|uniref:LysR family transcriptional regulator n=1 Tax=Devosia salina TaxID=2860336 RepID=A0ABX8WB64_9HYPH|nr:LysR substrate-binding domain-containing protein [Devosia salina]QYO75196.1 LysR family transcriptional regulator [Devosia salina]
MDTRQLKSLTAIARTGSFARAAELVNLTPSAVSQQIQALESEVGASLFDRSSRPPSLTPAGMQMVSLAEEVLRLTDSVVDAINGTSISGTLSLGSVRTSALGLLPNAITRLNALYPQVRTKLRVSMSETLMSDVVVGRLDAAMVAEINEFPSTLRWRPFLREPLLVIAPPGTAAGSASDLLARFPFVRFRSNVPLAHMIDRELARMNVVLNEVAEMDTVSSITACVINGLGVSVVPQIAVAESSVPLVTAPFGNPQVFRQIGLIESRSGAKAVLIDELHRQLVAASGSFGWTGLEMGDQE